MTEQDRGVYHRSVHGGKWSLINMLFQKGLHLVGFFILARILSPQDYGGMAIVLLVLGLLGKVTDFSWSDALTQRKENVESYLDVYFTVEVVRSVVLALLIFFFGGWVARFFNLSGAAVWVFRLSGTFLILSGFSNVRLIDVVRSLDLKKIFFRDLIAQTAATLTSIAFAVFVQPSVWALFAGYVVLYFFGTVFGYVIYPGRITFSFHWSRLKDLWGYSKWVYGQDFLDLLIGQMDKLFVGHWLTPLDLGFYSKSKDIASMPTALFTSLMSKVGLSAFSRIQDRLDKVRDGFLKSVDILLFTGLPAALVLLLEGGALVSFLLGPKWLPLVIPLKIFAFGNLFFAFVRIVNPVLGALGRPDINFKVNAIQAIVLVPSMFVGFHFFGMQGLAYAVVATWIVLLAYVILQTRPILNIAKKEFVPTILSGTVACAGTLFLDLVFRLAWPHAGLAIQLVRATLVGLFYFVLLFLIGRRLAKGPWDTFTSVLVQLGIKKRLVTQVEV